MSKPKWHPRIVSAIGDMAEDWGFESMYPSRVYIRLSDDRVICYNPDDIWLRLNGKKSIQVVLWEIENSPPPKSVAGDVALASMVRSRFAEFYPWEDFEIGKHFRKAVTFQDIYDKRRNSPQTMYPEQRRRFYGDEIAKLCLFIVFAGSYSVSYYERYIHAYNRKQWGKSTTFDCIGTFSCDSGDKETAKRSIGKSLSKYL